MPIATPRVRKVTNCEDGWRRQRRGANVGKAAVSKKKEGNEGWEKIWNERELKDEKEIEEENTFLNTNTA